MATDNSSLISTEPIVARNFFMEIADYDTLILQSVNGIEMELDVVSTTQNGKGGKQEHIKTLGGTLKTPEITVTRMAPQKAEQDKIWKWLWDIRDNGFTSRSDKRYAGSIVLYDGGLNEVARYNFHGAWPSKIVTDEVSTESNDALKEQITFQCEWVERVPGGQKPS